MHHHLLKSGEKLIIREVETQDAANLIAYVKQVGDETTFLTFEGSEFTKTVAEEEKIINNYQLANNQVFMIALINEKIVGLFNVGASHKKRLQHIGEFGISVLKNHWGKGIASFMMDAMILWAKDSKIIRKLNLVVLENNTAAIALYNKKGFQVEGRLTRDFKIKGKFLDSFRMGLAID